MALTFPLSLSDFADTLGVQTVKWLLQDNRELSGMGSGQILQADLAPSLRVADVTLRPWNANKAAEIEAKIEAMIRSQGSFYLYDPRKAVPRFDPRGTILGASAVKINSLPDAKSMSLKALPAGYRLSGGDYLHFDYGTPARRAFHRIVEAATANGVGVTPVFEVAPFIRPGAAVDIAVTLVKPSIKCVIRPGSINLTQAGPLTVISFSVVQKP